MANDVDFIENEDTSRPLSRYDAIRLYIGKDDCVVQETWEAPYIEERSDDTWHKVLPEQAHRPDLIALDFYNAAELYWVIASANNMIDPFAETTNGLQLRIPNRTNLFQNILIDTRVK